MAPDWVPLAQDVTDMTSEPNPLLTDVDWWTAALERAEQGDDGADSGTNLVGWAQRRGPREEGALEPRAILAMALAVEPESLAGLDQGGVDRALTRLRELVRRCHDLAAEAEIDELTGALRRGAGRLAIQRELDRARRVPNQPLAICFIDVDGLKQVNDGDGHAAGDVLLQTVVAVLKERLRSYDLVVRHGGDEFVCALSNMEAEPAREVLAGINAVLRERTDGNSISSGVAVAQAGETLDQVIARADLDLYNSRRNRVRTVNHRTA
jgi:diguanylate cyclase (GGDEF)-like protein